MGAALAVGALLGCGKETVATVAGPPLTTSPSTSTPTSTPASLWTSPSVEFVDGPGKLDSDLCSTVLVSVAKGTLSVAGGALFGEQEALGQGDTLVVAYPEPLRIKGSGLAVVAKVAINACNVLSRPALQKRIVRASAAADLAWAGGAMHARLDVGTDMSPDAYLGRLEGTAPVAEHTHPGSWEVICAVEASGTFTLDGKDRRLGPRGVVVVPPDTKHSWKPDAGARLVAIQIYSPPGPEQRFKTLAAGH